MNIKKSRRRKINTQEEKGILKYNKLASDSEIETTIASLIANGIAAIKVDTGTRAKEEVLARIPKGAEVFTMNSVTLETLGIPKEINESGSYLSVRAQLMKMDRNTQRREMTKLGAAPDYAVGSVHAVTQDGKLLVASNTGSQLPAYAYGAGKVIWVVGAQKIVRNVDEGMRRIYDYVLPLEGERLHKMYGTLGSNVSKLLIINKEIVQDRLTAIIVKERLGF